ncbi:hypothetical protein LguiA_014051 [Lonicera macranthoides]
MCARSKVVIPGLLRKIRGIENERMWIKIRDKIWMCVALGSLMIGGYMMCKYLYAMTMTNRQLL